MIRRRRSGQAGAAVPHARRVRCLPAARRRGVISSGTRCGTPGFVATPACPAAPLALPAAQWRRCPALPRPTRAPPPAPLRSAVVRDLPDLQRICLLFAQHLLCLEASLLHAAGNRRLQPSPAEERGQPSPADLAVDVCSALFRGRHSAQLAALQRLLPRDGQDMRLLFFRVGGVGGVPGGGGSSTTGAVRPGSVHNSRPCLQSLVRLKGSRLARLAPALWDRL